MNIFEFIQNLRKEHDLKVQISYMYSDLMVIYKDYKKEGLDILKNPILDNIKMGYWRKLLGDDFNDCYVRAYLRLDKWREIEDLKERVAILENKLKEEYK